MKKKKMNTLQLMISQFKDKNKMKKKKKINTLQLMIPKKKLTINII